MMKNKSASVRILVADDHEIVREGLRTLLTSRRGWQVCGEARDGREAVQLAMQLQPHVAVLDLSMPVLNGLEAARQIRRTQPRTEVLVLTMHESEDLAAAVMAGASNWTSWRRPPAEVMRDA